MNYRNINIIDIEKISRLNKPFPNWIFEARGTASYMFWNDVHTKIIPYSSNTNESSLVLKNKSVEETNNLHVLTRGVIQGRSSIENIIEDMIRNIGTDLAYFGKRYYELSPTTYSIENQEFSHQTLYSFHPTLNFFGQMIMQRTTEKPNIILIPRRRFWVFKLPKRLGGYWRFQLLHIGQYFANRNSPIGIDSINMGGKYKSYSYNKNVQRLSSSNKWKWDGRINLGWLDDHTEYYKFHRILEFRKSLAILREDIVRQLNDLLTYLGYSSRINLLLSTASDVENKIRELENGDISFKEVRDFLYHRN